MDIKKITLILAAMFFVTSTCQAEDVTPILTARKRPEPIKTKLLVLPDETVVLPGHMDSTKIEFEKGFYR